MVPPTGSSVRAAVDAFLSSPRCANRNTRRAYGDALDKLAGRLGPDRPLIDVFDDEIAEVITELWGAAAASTWNARRAAIGSWLAWCSRNGYPVLRLAESLERRPEHIDETRALSRTAIDRQLSRRDVPLREKTLWRMLYETAARASEILALNIEDLELDARRAKVVSKGGKVEHVYWGTGTAHLLPRLIRGRNSGPVFLTDRRPGPGRRPSTRDLCPTTGRARLGYDRARILFGQHTGWELHQLRHSAATHLGEKNVGLQLIMAKTRHRNPRTAMRYVRPGGEAVAQVTELLDLAPPRRG